MAGLAAVRTLKRLTEVESATTTLPTPPPTNLAALPILSICCTLPFTLTCVSAENGEGVRD